MKYMDTLSVHALRTLIHLDAASLLALPLGTSMGAEIARKPITVTFLT